jgi:hypothetical protein
MQSLRQGKATALVLDAGVYREGAINIDTTDDATARDAKLLIAGEGEVVISGSIVADKWTDEGNGIWSMPWPYNMHLFRSWNQSGPEGELGNRREMVFVDGQRLGQVLGRDELSVGSFFVDEQSPHEPDGTLYVKMPEGQTPASARVEVSVGPDHTTVLREKNPATGHYKQPWPPGYACRFAGRTTSSCAG